MRPFPLGQREIVETRDEIVDLLPGIVLSSR
jgi:hypothetical protein